MVDLTKIADADIELVVQWDDEDVAIGALQDLAGITDGGVAAMAFSEFDWIGSSREQRAKQVHAWLALEALYVRDNQ